MNFSAANYSPETTCGYIHAIKQFADYFGKSPEKLGGRGDTPVSAASVERERACSRHRRGAVSALHFLYKKTLKRRDIAYDDLVFPRIPRKLPVVLSQDMASPS